MDRFCAMCGKKLKDEQKRYCSVSCSNRDIKHRRDLKGEREGAPIERCAICGKPLSPKQLKYCSHECANIGRKKGTAERKRKETEKISISEIVARALKEHLTYGKYCEKYGL